MHRFVSAKAHIKWVVSGGGSFTETEKMYKHKFHSKEMIMRKIIKIIRWKNNFDTGLPGWLKT